MKCLDVIIFINFIPRSKQFKFVSNDYIIHPKKTLMILPDAPPYLVPSSRVADLHHIDADPDPACHFDADADPKPIFHLDAVPDPDPCYQIKVQNFEKVLK
jgi:hypothetical protein